MVDSSSAGAAVGTSPRSPSCSAAASASRVPDPAYPWTVTDGPWFDNNIALVTVRPDTLELVWVTGVVEDDPAHPRLEQVYAARLDPLPATAGVRVGSGAVQGRPPQRNTGGVA